MQLITGTGESLNTPPTLTGLPSTTQSVAAGQTAALVDFTVADADGNNLTVTLTPTNGSLGGLTDANPGLAGLQLSGTAVQINSLLAGATFTATAAGAASMAISVTDGIAASPTTGSYNFSATAITNAAPTSGNDTLTSTPDNDTIDGLGGVDTVNYSANLANYSISKTGSTYTVTDKTGADGTDTLANIESLNFTDFSVNLQIQGIAAAAPLADVARISELYVAFFNRTPDADGLAYWIDQHAAGQSINQISESFYSIGASANYASLTGFSTNMTNEDFIHVFYKNVLGRPEGADAGGLAYWNGKLAAGDSTRSSLANDILTSAHTFKGDTTWGWVADLLDNKIAVANKIAIEWGLTYKTDAYARGVAIAEQITATDISAALTLVGIADADLTLG